MASTNSTDPSPIQNTTDDTVLNSTSARAVSLILIMLLGLAGNIFVITAVGSSRKLKTSPVYIFSLNIAVTNIIDCFLNMSLTLGATVANSWELGELLCRFSSFFMTLISIELSLSLTFMTLDRMIATKHWSKYDQLQNIPRTCTMITYTWVHSLAFSLPIASGTVPTKVHSQIYVCLISDETSFIFVCILSISSFIIPFMIICCLFIVIIKTAYTERSVVRSMLAQHQYSRDIGEPKFCKELCIAKYVGVLVSIWFVLHLPYVINEFLRLYKYSNVLNPGEDISVEYIWYLDTLVLWMKFSFVIVLPVLLSLFNKDLWQTFRDFARCRKNNAVVDIVGKLDPQIRIKSDKTKTDYEKNLVKEEKVKEAFTHNSGFQVPVLFATSQGVHIQTYDEEAGSDCEDHSIRGKKCDVLGSQDLLNQIGSEETSDYDSGNEIDPFSVSHPVSSKNLNKSLRFAQRRSNSQPEVRSMKPNNRNSDTLVSVTAYSTSDSGVDISSGRNTLTMKKITGKTDGFIQQQQSCEGHTNSELNQTDLISNKKQLPHSDSNQKHDNILNESQLCTSSDNHQLQNSSHNDTRQVHNDTNQDHSITNHKDHNVTNQEHNETNQDHNMANHQDHSDTSQDYSITNKDHNDINQDNNDTHQDHSDTCQYQLSYDVNKPEQNHLGQIGPCHEKSLNEIVDENAETMVSEPYVGSRLDKCQNLDLTTNVKTELFHGKLGNNDQSDITNCETLSDKVNNDSDNKSTDHDINSFNSSEKSEITDEKMVLHLTQNYRSPEKSTLVKKRQKKQNRKEKTQHGTDTVNREKEVSSPGLFRPPARLEPLLKTNMNKSLYNRLIEEDTELFSSTPKTGTLSAIKKTNEYQQAGNEVKFETTDILHNRENVLSNQPPNKLRKKTLNDKKLTVKKLLMPDSVSMSTHPEKADVVTPSACDIIDISNMNSSILSQHGIDGPLEDTEKIHKNS